MPTLRWEGDEGRGQWGTVDKHKHARTLLTDRPIWADGLTQALDELLFSHLCSSSHRADKNEKE